MTPIVSILPLSYFLIQFFFLFNRYYSANEIYETDSGSNSTLEKLHHTDIRIEMIYDPAQELADSFKCLNAFHAIKAEFGSKFSVRKIDLSKGLLAKKEETPANLFKAESLGCRFGIRLKKLRILFERNFFSANLLKKWISRRVKRKIHSIHSEEDFYRISNEYFAVIYIYKGPQVARETYAIKHRLRVLAMEFPYTKIYYSFDKSINKNLKFANGHSLVLVRNFEDGHKTLFKDELIPLSEMQIMVSKFRFPFILWWNQSVFEYITQERQNVVILIIRRSKNYQLEAGFERVARVYKDKGYRFGVLDIHGNRVTHSKRQMLDLLGINPKSVIPTLMSITFKPQKGYNLLKCNNMSMTGMKNFLLEIFGESVTTQSHCIQNQFLPSLKLFGPAKPLNYDSFLDLRNIKSDSQHKVLVYRSGLKSNQKFVIAFRNISEIGQESGNPNNYFLYDRSLNAMPLFLKHLRHLPNKKPFIVEFSKPSIDDENQYLPEIKVFQTKKSMLEILDQPDIERIEDLSRQKLVHRKASSDVEHSFS